MSDYKRVRCKLNSLLIQRMHEVAEEVGLLWEEQAGCMKDGRNHCFATDVTDPVYFHTMDYDEFPNWARERMLTWKYENPQRWEELCIALRIPTDQGLAVTRSRQAIIISFGSLIISVIAYLSSR